MRTHRPSAKGDECIGANSGTAVVVAAKNALVTASSVTLHQPSVYTDDDAPIVQSETYLEGPNRPPPAVNSARPTHSIAYR